MGVGPRRDLEEDLFALLPAEYHGYLMPQRGEERGPNRERLLVYLLHDLTTALQSAMDRSDFSFSPDDREPQRVEPHDHVDDHRLRVQRRAVWLYLGVDQHPCGFEDAIKLATGSYERTVVTSRGGKRPLLLDGFAQTFDALSLPERRASRRARVPRRVALANMRGVDRWLRQASITGPGSKLFAAWQSDRGQDVSRMALLLVTLQVAAERFSWIKGGDALEQWYSLHAGERYFRPDRACRLCPARKFGGASCTCAARVMSLAAGSRRSGPAGNRRSRDWAVVGQAAVEIAAHSLVAAHPREWPARETLKWVLGQYPVRRRPSDVTVPEGLAALGALLRDELPHQREIELAAAFIDETRDPGILSEVAELGRAAFARHADHEPGTEHERALAELARTLAGAFRELRSPASAAFQRQLARTAIARHPKALEALQDLQLAEQRLLRWAPAAAGYELALDLLAERFPGGTQKRFEIEEQLHLGRLGGLILEAEQLLFQKRTSPAVRARIVALLDAAIALGGEGGRLQGALEQIVVHQQADTVSPEERDVLRYNDRWHVMPQIMLSRALVTRAAFAVQTGDPRREDDLKRAREIHEALACRRDLTARQRWEIERVALVAGTIAGEGAELPARVDRILAAGGDDGGDYVTPAITWLSGQEPSLGARLTSLLREAAPALLVVRAAVPRLPDVEVRQS